jgi:uncharacterized membrane protein
VSWHARSFDCRRQPLLDEVHNLHHCRMNSIRVTRGQAIVAESPQLVPGTFVRAAAFVVLTHTVVMIVHGAAHMRLNVELSAWANLYVLCIIGTGPIAGFFLLRSRRQRTGATILFATMIGALLFGLWNHFIAHGPDHIMHLQAVAWRLPFQATAVLLAVSELAGAIGALMLLYSLTRQTKARNR